MLLFLWESHRAPMLTFMLLRFREPHGVIPWSTWCDSVKYMVWSCEPYGVILWNTWFDCVNHMVWSHEAYVIYSRSLSREKHGAHTLHSRSCYCVRNTEPMLSTHALAIAWETRSPCFAFTLSLSREKHGAHAFHSRSHYMVTTRFSPHALAIAWGTRSPCFPLTLLLSHEKHGAHTLHSSSCYHMRNTEPTLCIHALTT